MKKWTENILWGYKNGKRHVSNSKIYQKVVHWHSQGFVPEHNKANQSVSNQVYDDKDRENYPENNFCNGHTVLMETSLSVVHKVQVQTVNGKFSRRAETEIVCFQVRQHKSSYGFLYVQEKIETKFLQL